MYMCIYLYIYKYTNTHSHLEIYFISLFKLVASQVVLVVNNPAANAGDIKYADSIPESGRSHGGGQGNTLQYSYLNNCRDREAWQATIYRISKSQAWLKQLAHMLLN